MPERALVLDHGKELYRRARDRLRDRIDFVEVRPGGQVPSFSPDSKTLAAFDALIIRTPFRHVVATSESDMAFAGFLRSRYGLAGLDAEQALIATNKWRMKRAVRPHYPTAAAWLSGEFLQSNRARPESVVIKPLSGSSARGVRKLPLDEALRVLSGSGELMLVEEALPVDGELHCDGLVRDGRLDWVVVSAYDRPVLHSRNTRGSIHLPSSDQRADVRPAIRQILAAFPFADFVFHLELLDVQGDLIFGEIGLRPGGGGIAESIGRCHGSDLWLEFVGLQVGIQARLSPPPRHRDDLCGVVGVVPPPDLPAAPAHQLLRLPGVTAVRRGNLPSGERPRDSCDFSHLVFFEGLRQPEVDGLIHALGVAPAETS